MTNVCDMLLEAGGVSVRPKLHQLARASAVCILECSVLIEQVLLINNVKNTFIASVF